MRTFCCQLLLANNVWALFSALWRWEVDGGRSLRSTPATLTDKEARANSSRVYLSSLFIDNRLLGLHHGARLALVINSKNLGPQLEFSALGRRRKWFQELDKSLPVDNTLCVEFGNAGDRVACLSSIEVNDFLCGLLESCCMLIWRFDGTRAQERTNEGGLDTWERRRS